jgi:hypothetical protein
MPGLAHEGAIELLRFNPRLAAALVRSAGVMIETGPEAVMVSGDVSSALPTELRADAVIMLGRRSAADEARNGLLTVVVEVQTSRDERKRRVWPAYLALARAQHDCPAVLLVICLGRDVGRWARQPIRTGHPGFDLVPLVIDAANTPPSASPGLGWASAELAVLGALTGAVDLDHEADRRLVLASVATGGLDAERLETYTHLIRACASPAAREALEGLMTTLFKDEFIDRIKAEGRAEGRARGQADMLVRILVARGFDVPDAVRERILACTDLQQLESWGERAATAGSLHEVFAS